MSERIDRAEELRFKNYERKIDGTELSGLLPQIASKAERRAYALANGTEVRYLGCVLCGLNRPMYKKDGFAVETREGRQTNRFLALTEKVVQIRKGGGKTIGFHTVNELSLGYLYTSSVAEERAIFDNLKEEVIKIMDEIEHIEKGLI